MLTSGASIHAPHVISVRDDNPDTKGKDDAPGVTGAALALVEWFQAKAKKYYRCGTCASHPVREQSHFQQRRGRAIGERCQKQRLSEAEKAAWVAQQIGALDNRTVQLCRLEDLTQVRVVCNICYNKFPDGHDKAGLHHCAVCRQGFRVESKAQRSNHRQRPDVPLVCMACRDSGYTPHDRRSYECHRCHRLFGRGNFMSSAIRNYNRRMRGRLTCQTCLKCHSQCSRGKSEQVLRKQYAAPR